MGIQSVSRISENFDRLRTAKFDSYNSTPVHKVDSTTYQNVRNPSVTATFNNVSSDSSSSVNTPSVGVSSTTTPNTSDTSSEAEPSLPSSPDNNADQNQATQNEDTNEPAEVLNTSMGVLSLNESSTATNTSLNVSLPPSESPKSTQNLTQNVSQNSQNESQEGSSTDALETPGSSKTNRPSGPDSLLNFGLGLQAALSPSHGKDANYMSRHREHREREKRHSLTASSHLQGNHSTQNRHSAEILATSLLDHAPERDRERPERERERERRRRRSRSNECPLPASYVALYPYKPQKADELELKKGGVYTVTERCRDGWYKGRAERSQRAGVFPGNYVTPAPSARHKHDKNAGTPSTASVKPIQAVVVNCQSSNVLPPPDAPPRANSPLHTGQPLTYPWSSPTLTQQTTPKSEKSKEKSKAEKSSISSGVSLMKRLAAMKKCKSPPPVGYSMDNPVFEDGPGPGTSLMLNLPGQPHPVHVRSGSCPSQLLRALPAPDRRHKDRPDRSDRSDRSDRLERHAHDHHAHRGTNEGPWQSQHRKSQSLDVTAPRRDRHHSQPAKERFRCIAPYPPNSDYELELKVDDIVLVSKKRGDGWYKGTLERTGRTGLFPASFVQSYPPE